ncbi:MAG TPA: DUF3108 domain-containing protein [Thermoanaerobaculia bacterium]
MKIIRKIVIALTMVVSASAFAANPGSVEEFRYSWRLRGGVRLLAGLMFPTSGVGNLRTTFGDTIHSELLITAPTGKQGGFYEYESQMDERAKTLMTYHGYAWGKKARNERTVFDYGKGLARINKETPEDKEYRVKKLPAADGQYRDILSAIYFLRQNAKTINAPMQTTIFTDGREYPVIFRPGETKAFVIEGKSTNARAFHIVDAPGGKKWSGGVTVWLTNDDRRVPVRIEIQQSVASLQLDLQKIESGALLAGL